MTENRTEQASPGLDSVMRAVLALLADEREARIANDENARKTEVLLRDAGFSLGEIAALLGKNYKTVQSTLRRAT
jgi:DNA-directed RNA polymerase specialized sigma24 family protein